MAVFNYTTRGGLIVDRDSLHATPEYARQIEAAKQLRDQAMNADVEKAVELAEVRNEMRGDSGRYPNGEGWGHCYRVDGYWLPKDAWQTIRQHMRYQEAEIANLKDDRDSWRDQASDRVKDWDDMRKRSEKAEALLRDLTAPSCGLFPDLVTRITTHLGATQHD